MSFDDFFSNFHKMPICHRAVSSLTVTDEETRMYQMVRCKFSIIMISCNELILRIII